MKEIEDWLYSRVGLNFRKGLERVQEARLLLGKPDEAYPIIHVTGTNGKGSTIAFLRSLLMAHGQKVGTFTSPHIVTIRDRICVDGEPISEADFVRLVQQVEEMEETLRQSQDSLSFFEILTLMGFLYFKEQEVDVVLLEVGIGGLLDTTNIVTGEISVISSIGLDHQETLGNSIEEIAEQKAGIFKAAKMALIGPLPSVARAVCQEIAQDLSTELRMYGEDFQLSEGFFRNKERAIAIPRLGLQGEHQKENAALAIEAFLAFMDKRNLPILVEQMAPALEETRWAGRLEFIEPNIYLDGAHNLAAMERLSQVISTYPQDTVSILFGALKRKDYQAMLDYLQERFPQADLYLTSFGDSGSLGEGDVAGISFLPSYQSFLEEFQEEKQKTLFVVGSLYFVAEVRAYLLEKQKN
ncbi:bifunctional folylpolyglutamate synthase/dihydrofolate synthase [Streptococcus himalayensis]|uniref:tetrahydrofolate synthase n=1 Tax=Streptococcus himalayensis TaxID=1888195 RepID=A0A917A2U8_9STRE|nr:folylpolyglutamate synthase/dihydrofolate synthase family protein [Streptococcus himalayensis]GGE23132.1 dihydrofolate synthase [Streptococcus himalayensis]